MLNSNITITYPADPDARKTIVGFQLGQADLTTGQFISPGALVPCSMADADNGKVPAVPLKGVGLQRIRCELLDATGAVKGFKLYDHDYGYPLPDLSIKSSSFTYTVTATP